MNQRPRLAAAFAAVALVSTLAASPHSVDAERDRPVGNPQQAIFGDQTIDLSRSWGDAQACIELNTETRCYRTESELLKAHRDILEHVESTAEAAITSACSSSLALWDLAGQNPPVIYLTTRQTYHNLSSFNFDRKTSSYRIGACSAQFFDGQHGAGSVYPGSTSAGTSVGSMVSGWNNRIRSIYIY